MPQYMLSVHHVGAYPDLPPDQMQATFDRVEAFNQDLLDKDAWVFGGGLHPIDTATTVSVVDGEPVVTDGPFAESKEFLGGFWVIDVADLDEALDWARRATVACDNPVEVRPFQDEPEA